VNESIAVTSVLDMISLTLVSNDESPAILADSSVDNLVVNEASCDTLDEISEEISEECNASSVANLAVNEASCDTLDEISEEISEECNASSAANLAVNEASCDTLDEISLEISVDCMLLQQLI